MKWETAFLSCRLWLCTSNAHSIVQKSNIKNHKYKFGNRVSALVAGGYAIPTSEQSRILISLESNTGFMSDNQMNRLGLTVNGLW